MNTRIKLQIDLSKIRGAFTRNIVGKELTKECICIPKDMLYRGKDGALYLDLIGYEDEQRNYGRLYSLKQNLCRSEYDAVRAEGKQTPFVGNIKAFDTSVERTQATAHEQAPAPTIDEAPTDDLPF